jgi:hypothetical protein
MLSISKIVDDDVTRATKVITEDNQKVKDFLNSEEVVTLVEDKELFEYYFTVMDSIDGWTEY